jgi:hypothetical protein
MKKIITILMLVLLSSTIAYSQDETLDARQGWRIKSNGIYYKIYVHNATTDSPKFDDYRKINDAVYFKKVDVPVKTIGGVNYQLITIPSKLEKADTNIPLAAKAGDEAGKSGYVVTSADFNKDFWINVNDIENNSNIQYKKYANDFFSGALTAPFKYRLGTGDNTEAVIDGDFNIAPFFGWKMRVSDSKPYYVAPFGFAGITTLEYNSANNSKITDPTITENGSGFTYGIGISFKFGDISPGFILGWDNSFGNLGDGFMYKDKPWISFSINYDFFGSKQTEPVEQ